MRSLSYALLIIILATGSASAFTERELNNHAQILMRWWPGEYDNHGQVVRQSPSGIRPLVNEPVFRLYTHYVALDLPALGDHVLYVEEHKNDDPADIYRIRLLSLSVDEEDQGVRVKLHAFHDQDSMIGAHADSARLDAIEVSDTRAYSDSCDVLMRYEGAQFRGTMARETCGGEESWFEYEQIVGPDYYWFRDRRISHETGDVVWEFAPDSNFVFFQMPKVRRFVCTVHYNLDNDMYETEYLTSIELHDQGDVVDLDWPDGRTLEFQLYTEEFTMPSESERVFPMFVIREKGITKPISYAYTVDDADRFGINLGWFYTLCRIKDQGAAMPPA